MIGEEKSGRRLHQLLESSINVWSRFTTFGVVHQRLKSWGSRPRRVSRAPDEHALAVRRVQPRRVRTQAHAQHLALVLNTGLGFRVQDLGSRV